MKSGKAPSSKKSKQTEKETLTSTIWDALPEMPAVLINEVADYAYEHKEMPGPFVIIAAKLDLSVLKTLADKYAWEYFSWKDQAEKHRNKLSSKRAFIKLCQHKIISALNLIV